MPYVVTTKRRTHRCTNPAHEHVSRRAVATLEEARKMCITLVKPYAAEEARGPAGGPVAAICLPLMRNDWSGDPIGPLPDGTVIEVEPIRMSLLRTMVEHELGQYGDDDQILADFNARQESS